VPEFVMNEACATDLGKAAWRVASQDVGRILPVVIDGRVVEMFCVPLVQMMSTLISIATMPEYQWMERKARRRFLDHLTR
jgi:hypothetical protein